MGRESNGRVTTTGTKTHARRLNTRPDFSRLAWGAFTAVAALGVVWPSASAAASPRPNILFVLSDDHSVQTIGAYNHRLSDFCRQHQLTPNLDRLAEQGVVFQNSFCGNSICSPSRATILTGLHAHRNGVTHLNQGLRPGIWTFPQAFQAGGYQTALIGKWHLTNLPEGFDFYRILPGQGHYWQPDFEGPNGFKETVRGYVTDIITQKAIEFLKSRDGSKPFLLLVHHKAPHRWWEPPTRYYRLLDGVTVPEPATLFDDYAGRASAARRQRMEIGRDMSLAQDLKVLPRGNTPPRLTPEQAAAWRAVFEPRNDAFRQAGLQGRELTRWKYQEYMKDYLRCVKAVDDSVGELLDYLDRRGLATNTVVIYSSDQGFFNGEHGWFDKRFIYEESLRMPLILRWPGVVQPGTRIPHLVQNIDYAPTLAEIAGLPVPDSVQGVSLLPLLVGKSPSQWRRSIYYRYYDPGHAVMPHYGLRTERYTLAHFLETDEWELFDLERDPEQLRSVHDHPEYVRTFQDLKSELTRLQHYYQDPAATPPNPDRLLPNPKPKTE